MMSYSNDSVSVENPSKSLSKPKVERAFSFPVDLVTFSLGEGENKKKFIVHEEFVRKHSYPLAFAFSSAFKEGETKEYNIEDTTEGALQFLCQWFYREKLDLLVSHESFHSIDDEGHEKLCAEQDLLLAELWALGEKYMIQPLQNYVMTLMLQRQHICGRMNPKCYHIIYENTPEDSPLRRLAVDQVAWLGKGMRDVPVDIIPAQMLYDIVVLLQKQTPANVRNKRAAAMAADDYQVSDS